MTWIYCSSGLVPRLINNFLRLIFVMMQNINSSVSCCEDMFWKLKAYHADDLENEKNLLTQRLRNVCVA